MSAPNVTPLTSADGGQAYQEETTHDLARIIASWQKLRQISAMETDIHVWAILMLRELTRIRSDSDLLIRKLAVDFAQSRLMQQQEIARITGFSRNTISNWVRGAANQSNESADTNR